MMNDRNAGRPLRVLACCAAAVVVALLAWCASAAAQEPVHVTARIMYLEVDPGLDGDLQFLDETVFSQEPALVGDGMLAGLEGDTAEGQGRVDLRTGELGASAAIRNALYPGGWSRTTASSMVEMRVKLLVATPPGNHPLGFDIGLPYNISGLLQADLQNLLGGSVSGLYMSAEGRLALGLTTFQDIVDLVTAPDAATMNRQGELRVTITPPFSTTPTVTELNVSAFLQTDVETAGIDPSPLLLSGVTLGVDINRTVTLGPLQVPDGVTWTSESGMFLTGPPIPEPGALGLTGLALLGLRRRRG